jgi:hypothetical protein
MQKVIMIIVEKVIKKYAVFLSFFFLKGLSMQWYENIEIKNNAINKNKSKKLNLMLSSK